MDRAPPLEEGHSIDLLRLLVNIKHMLDSIASERKEVILMGDMNINLL